MALHLLEARSEKAANAGGGSSGFLVPSAGRYCALQGRARPAVTLLCIQE